MASDVRGTMWLKTVVVLNFVGVVVLGRSIDSSSKNSTDIVFEYGAGPGQYRPVYVSNNRDNKTRVIPMVEWEAEDIPHPLFEPHACGRVVQGTSMFCDPSFILSSSEAAEVEKALGSICHQTKCRCPDCPAECPGVRAGVLVVPKIKFNLSIEDEADRMEDWASFVREQWELGTCEDGLLIIYSARDHFITHTSYGLAMSDEIWPVCLEAIYNENKHSYEKMDLGRALVETLKAYRSRLTGKRIKATGCREDFPYFLPTAERIAIIYGIVCLPLMICVIFVFLGPCFRGPGFGGSKSKAGLTRGWTHRSAYEGYDSRWIATPSTSKDPRLE